MRQLHGWESSLRTSSKGDKRINAASANAAHNNCQTAMFMGGGNIKRTRTKLGLTMNFDVHLHFYRLRKRTSDFGSTSGFLGRYNTRSGVGSSA